MRIEVEKIVSCDRWCNGDRSAIYSNLLPSVNHARGVEV